MISKEVKAGNIKFLYTNHQFINKEENIKLHLEAGSIEVHGEMVQGGQTKRNPERICRNNSTLIQNTKVTKLRVIQHNVLHW